MFEKVVLVTKTTALQGLRKRYGTTSQAQFVLSRAHADFHQYLSYDDIYRETVDFVQANIPKGIRVATVESAYVPTYQFDPGCLVVPIGPDGLVVNTAKYLHGQPIFAVNPDPSTIDGVLARNHRWAVSLALNGTKVNKQYLSMAEALMPDGQRLLAVNDLFIGHESHQSARYEISYQGQSERHSSSGIIVSTGSGSTGWHRSILTGAAAIIESFGDTDLAQHVRDRYVFPPEDRSLVFTVREPFVSRASTASIVFDRIDEPNRLQLTSEMPSGGVIFSDGVQSDFLSFNSGATVEIGLAEKSTELWTLAY